jgi:hypothetical protein
MRSRQVYSSEDRASDVSGLADLTLRYQSGLFLLDVSPLVVSVE